VRIEDAVAQRGEGLGVGVVPAVVVQVEDHIGRSASAGDVEVVAVDCVQAVDAVLVQATDAHPAEPREGGDRQDF
jgi:hypothetical protein